MTISNEELGAAIEKNRRLLIFILRKGLSQQDSEDIANETWKTALETRENFHFEGSESDRCRVIQSWLIQIAKYHASNLFRKTTRRARLLRSMPVTGISLSTLERILATERQAIILGALDTLDVVSRRILEMKHAEGATHREISDQTGIPECSVSKQLSLARDALKAALQAISDLSIDEILGDK